MTHYITLPYRSKDISGQRFGRLVVLGPVRQNARRCVVWRCRCDCGEYTEATSSSLRSGHTSSCGCLRLERSLAAVKTHGMTETRLYYSWTAILARCFRPGAKGYPDYGGRGITVCDEWRQDFQAFHDYVTRLPNYRSEGATLDRIDNDGNYEPGNVRWAERRVQARNTRRNVMLTHDGRTQCMSDWADELGIHRETLRRRFALGWSVEQALTTPVQFQPHHHRGKPGNR